MSSRRRNRGDNTDDILGDLGANNASAPFDGMTASDIADAAYESGIGHDDPFAKLGRNREKIHLTVIDAITPNLTQPRRAIPTAVRQYWSGLSDDESMATFFQRWLDEINIERRAAKNDTLFPIDAYLAGEATNRIAGIEDEAQLDQIGTSQIGPKERAIMPLVDLAASIHRDGLINPISIAKQGKLWEIETGERRWLAYQLLNWRLAGDDYLKIPARQVDHVSIWRQSTENNTRSDLNAIARARQFALLLMDILSDENNYQTFDGFDHEQSFYAQVSDGNLHRVPRTRGEDILNAMGLENPVQLRQYRALLRLPQPVWEWADDLNWTESFIRKEIDARAIDDEDKIRLAVKQALAEGYTVSSVTVYEHLLEQDKPKPVKKAKLTFDDLQSSTLAKLETQLSKLGKSDKKKAIEYLQHLLDELKQ